MDNQVFDKFFNWGNKVTKGDPIKKSQFDYALLWVMFLAFFSILISNFISFVKMVPYNLWGSLKYLGWAGVMFAILWFQYNALAQSREVLKLMMKTKDKAKDKIEKEMKNETFDEMLKEFK